MTKTILVTGATDGIGLLTAKSLVEDGHKVLIHGRSANRLTAAKVKMGGDVETYLADMSKMADVHAMADEILRAHRKVDVLINNAGVLKAPNTKVEGGYDLRFMVNTFAPYVLTQKLLRIIPKDGRIVNFSSAAQAPVDVDALHGRDALDDMGAYAQSKLGITIWTREMAKALPNGPVVVAVNPGSLLASKMVKEGFGVAGSDLSIGANILCEAAVGDSFANASGKYFDNDSGAFALPHEAALDDGHTSSVMQALEAAITNIG